MTTEKECDRLFQVAVLERDNYTCQTCDLQDDTVTAHHVFSRTNNKTRHDSRNGIAMCHKCHTYFAHGQPLRFKLFIMERIGDDMFFQLMIMTHSIDRAVDYDTIKQTLLDEIKEVKCQRKT